MKGQHIQNEIKSLIIIDISSINLSCQYNVQQY